jgi:two-component system, cell cycle response regulator DivK
MQRRRRERKHFSLCDPDLGSSADTDMGFNQLGLNQGATYYSQRGLHMENMTILVIEDNEMNMKLMRAVLKAGKYQMLEAPDAETGLRLVREHHPDLVLMDIQLPGMDGLSAAQIIRADPDLQKIPIFALTGFAMQSDREKAMGIGLDGYIVKPFSVKALLETLEQFFARRHDENKGK